MNKLIYTFLVVLIINSCNKLEPINWVDYKTIDNTISFKYPNDWRLDNSNNTGISILLFQGKENTSDDFNENINLTIQDLQNQNMNLDTYVELSEKQLKTIQGSIISKSERTVLNGNEAHFIEYQANLTKKELSFMQYYIVKHQKAYLITFTSEIDKFQDNKEKALEIMNTFNIN